MVASIVIEQERVTPTRYSGRITVNFNPSRVRSALGSRATAAARPEAAPAERGDGTAALPSVAAPQGPPASNWVEAVATYRSLNEWIELRRRLAGAGPVASVDVVGIAVDAARVRIGLRAPAQAAAGELAALGIAMVPVRGRGAGRNLAGGPCRRGVTPAACARTAETGRRRTVAAATRRRRCATRSSPCPTSSPWAGSAPCRPRFG
jgi:hypothetical protein